MSKISQAFANGKAFIPFITCGDPDLETTAAVVRAAVENGADLIELGIPFSDPTAEGPVIQAANLRALRGGVTTDRVFDLVRGLRRDVSVPMVFMTYANVVYSYGAEKFISTCAEIGIDGLILPDLPFEEKDEFLPVCERFGVDLISMIAPTSENRIAMIAREARGFLYLVSSLGVTGTRSEITTDLASIVRVVRENTDIPCAVGFGISTPAQAKAMADLSDGAIVGSAIVRLIGQYGSHDRRSPIKIASTGFPVGGGDFSYPVFQNIRRQFQHSDRRVAHRDDLIVHQILRQHARGDPLRQFPRPVLIPGLGAVIGKQAGHLLPARLHPVQLRAKSRSRFRAFIQIFFHLTDALNVHVSRSFIRIWSLPAVIIPQARALRKGRQQ